MKKTFGTYHAAFDVSVAHANAPGLTANVINKG